MKAFMFIIAGLLSALIGYEIALLSPSPSSSSSFVAQAPLTTACPDISTNIVVQTPSSSLMSKCPPKMSIDLQASSATSPIPCQIPTNRTEIDFVISEIRAGMTEHLFANLHHPASMNKVEYILHHNKHMKQKIVDNRRFAINNCRHIYHTRTGSRTNQPAKCVALVTVGADQTSMFGIVHRHGVTAGRTNQFFSDFVDPGSINKAAAISYAFLENLKELQALFMARIGDQLKQNNVENVVVMVIAGEERE